MVYHKTFDFIGSVNVYHGPKFNDTETIRQIKGITLKEVTAPDQLEDGAGILLLDHDLKERVGGPNSWKTGRLWPFMVICEDGCEHGDFLVPKGWPNAFALKAIEAAIREQNLLLSRRALSNELDSEHEKLFQLTHIGLALSAEKNLDRLLTTILAEGRRWACCDAASLFLVERNEDDPPQLLFKLTQNDSVDCPFEEKRFTLNKESISGYVAVTGDILNLPDVYQLPERTPFHFNSSFDESIGYHTRSMLTIPMKNHKQEVIGVLQFINRKSAPEIRLASKAITEEHTRPFTDDLVVLLKALASQAAVAIGNTLLVNQIEDLFEGFVSAAVTAIEQRDPTTSGHSFRVAELTTSLAVALPRSGVSRFKALRFNSNQLKEIRYASLLHDFGKVGVREPVLVKEKKLPKNGLEIIWQRFTIYKEQLRKLAAEQRLKYLYDNGKEAYDRWITPFNYKLEEELSQMSRFYEEIAKANEPSILPEGRFHHLADLRDMEPFFAEGRQLSLLSGDEFLALSVRKGSLTESERKEIESHVVHTFNFLNRIPWTSELKRIPAYAVAHHEKLNGSGYPYGWKESQIPLESKIMTVSDIFDALTASDRPYKKAIGLDRALDILKMEADKDLLDKDLVNIFIEAKIHDILNEQKEPIEPYDSFSKGFERSVCNYDVKHDH